MHVHILLKLLKELRGSLEMHMGPHMGAHFEGTMYRKWNSHEETGAHALMHAHLLIKGRDHMMGG